MVSVIIPVYNTAKFLRPLIDSLINQTYKDLEIIFVDDKSTDNSFSIIQEYIKKNHHIKLVTLNKNMGVSYARNVGLDQAKGSYIMFIDSDDLIDQDAIKKAMNLMLETNADVVELERILVYKYHNKTLTFKEIGHIRDNTILNNKQLITKPRYITGKLYKKEVIANNRFDIDLKCYEDTLFNHQIKKNINKYIYLKGYNYYYLQRKISLVNSINTNHLSYMRVATKIKELYAKDSDDINKLVNKVIILDIIVIMAQKIPMMAISKKEKLNYIEDFTNLCDELKLHSIVLSLFKNKLLSNCYLTMTSKMNLITLGFLLENIFHKIKIKDHKMNQEIIKLYK